MQIDPLLSIKKLKSKWIKGLHIKSDKLKLIEETVGKNLKHIDTGDIFMKGTAMAHALKSRIDKWGHIKLKHFCKAKDTVNRTKQQCIDLEKIFPKPITDRRLTLKICKEVKKIDSREPHKPIKQ